MLQSLNAAKFSTFLLCPTTTRRKLSRGIYDISSHTHSHCGYRCSDIQFGLEDLPTYVHLLNVALNTKLCLGKIHDALELGN